MKFDVAVPGRLFFGAGRVSSLGEVARELLQRRGAQDGNEPHSLEGRTAFVVTGSSPERVSAAFASLEHAGFGIERYTIRSEPGFDEARDALSRAQEAETAIVVGIGGGSALDLAKVVAALLANPGDPMDYAEVIGAGRSFVRESAPYIAVPTTAGTGSEVTRNAVLVSKEHRMKVSLRSPTMLPAAAIVDPELTYSMPPEITVQSGMDALTQLIESFVSPRASPFTDGICREAIPRAARALPRVFENGQDAAARADMAFAGLAGGIALSNAGLGAVHGIAGPLGGAFPVPHGSACAALLAPVTALNLKVLREREPTHPSLHRYAELAELLGAPKGSGAEDAVGILRHLSAGLGVRGLASFGLTRESFPDLAVKAASSSSMKGNPVMLRREEICFALEAAMGL
jgi:alcohol dehydrogenase class IV